MIGLLPTFGLLKKEWREHRGLVFGLALAAPLLSILAKWLVFGLHRHLPTDSAIYVLPGMVGIYLLAVAADLVAADSAAGRHVFLAAQPVCPIRVWSAKCLFLFGSAILFLGWLMVTETIQHVAFGHGGSYLFTAEAWRYAWLYPIVALAASATFLWSTLIDRGLTAVFGAAFTLALLVAALYFLVARPLRFVDRDYGITVTTSLVLAAAFLGGSMAVFCGGRLHLGGRLRRIVLAVIGVLVVALPPTAHAAVRLVNWYDFDPHGPDACSVLNEADAPDDWILVGTWRGGRPPFGTKTPSRFLAVNLADGRVRDLTGYGFPLSSNRVREPEGTVRLAREDGNDPVKTRVITDYDLEAGAPRRTRAWDPRRDGNPVQTRSGGWVEWRGDAYRVHRHDGRVFELPPGIRPGYITDWGATFVTQAKPRTWGVVRFGDGIVLRTSRPVVALPAAPRGDVISCGEDGVWRVSLETGEESLLFSRLAKTAWRTSPDTGRLALTAGETVVVCTAGTGEVVTYQGRGRRVHAVAWAADSRSFVALGGGRAYVGRIGGTALESFAHVGRANDIGRFDGRRLLYHVGEPRKLYMVTEGGTPRRIPEVAR